VNTTTIEQLTRALDLTPNEISIYKGFTDNPNCSAARLSTILNMDKSSTYRSVSNLVEYGLLIPVPQGDTMCYKAADPEAINERYTEKVKTLQNFQSTIESFVSTLVSSTERKTHIRSETGLSAVQKAMTESLDCKEKLIREIFFNHTFFKNKLHREFIDDYIVTRCSKDIVIHQYTTKKYSNKAEYAEVQKARKDQLKIVKILPEELEDMNSFRIWDNTMNFFSEDERGETLVITITDMYVVKFFKKIYDFIWKQCKDA
jgi:sugar-specific transcriptional regulator TrmB